MCRLIIVELRLLVAAALFANSVVPAMALVGGDSKEIVAIDSPQRVTWAEALELLERNNMELRRATAAVEEARGRSVTAGLFPNPSFEFSREDLSGSTLGYHESYYLFSQRLELVGQRKRRLAVAESELNAVEIRRQQVHRRLTFELVRNYLRAAGAVARIKIVQETIEVFRRVEQAGAARVEHGDLSAFALQRLQLELVLYESVLADTELSVTAAGRELAQLLIGDESLFQNGFILPAEDLEDVAIPEWGFSSPEEALGQARNRPDLRALLADVETAGARRELTQRERVPDLTITGGYKEQSDGLSGTLVAFSIPLPLFNRNQGRIAETAAAEVGTQSRYLAALRAVEAELYQAWDVYRSRARRLEYLDQDLLRGSRELLRVAQLSWAEGEMSLVELLDAAGASHTARTASLDLRLDYLLSLYDLERATGGARTLVVSSLQEETP